MNVLRTMGRATVSTPVQTQMDHSTAHVLRDSPWTMMASLVMTLMNVKWTMATALRSVSISLVTTLVLVLMDMLTQGPMVLTSSVLTLVSSGNRLSYWLEQYIGALVCLSLNFSQRLRIIMWFSEHFSTLFVALTCHSASQHSAFVNCCIAFFYSQPFQIKAIRLISNWLASVELLSNHLS